MKERSSQISVPLNWLLISTTVDLCHLKISEEVLCYEALFSDTEDLTQEYPLLVDKASVDPETMYMYQEMKQADKEDFISAMFKEIKGKQGNLCDIVHTQHILNKPLYNLK